MATVNLETPFREVGGNIREKGIIYRRKHFRDDKGRIISEGKQEAYAVSNPRDYQKTPPQGAELQHISLFRQACLITKEILSAKGPDAELYQDYLLRFNAQLPRTRGTRPDPQAPVDKTTGKRRRYSRLDNFIRSMVYLQLTTTQPNP